MPDQPIACYWERPRECPEGFICIVNCASDPEFRSNCFVLTWEMLRSWGGVIPEGWVLTQVVGDCYRPIHREIGDPR